MSLSTIIVIAIAFLALVGIISNHILKSKQIQDNNATLIDKEQELEETILDYSHTVTNIEKQIEELNSQKQILQDAVNKENNNLSNTQSKIEMENQHLEKILEQFQAVTQQLKDYEKNGNKYIQELEDKLVARAEELVELYDKETNQHEDILIDMRQKAQAAIKHNIADYESKDNKNFYKLQINERDLEDIRILRTIEPRISKKEVLGKIIYKSYIEKYYTDLAGRVIGNKIITGIYKITNVENGKCYVGQAVDIKKRWQQHIKRAVGAETPTANKLYPAMREEGIENFSFEILDECEKAKLSEREQYWQDFYGAKVFGYSIK